MSETAHPSTAAGGFNVLQVTDCHLFASPERQLRDMRTLDTLSAVLGQAADEAVPDAILATGDIAQEPHPETYATFLAAVRAHFDAPLLCVPGNHDSEPLLSSSLPVEPLTLANDEGASPGAEAPDGWRLVGIDTHIEGETGGRTGSAVRARLAQDISAADEHVLVAGHHAPLRIGTDWLDVHRIEDGDELLACLGTQGASGNSVRAYVFGHVHQAVDMERGSLRLLASPSTCFQFTPNSAGFGIDDKPPGYRWLSLHADGSLTTEVRWLRDKLPPTTQQSPGR
ncbi:MAG: phosphodiesterase [Gammaproteobacteria bacterium]|nr:phosphodiesterase [Gammaproteobacteria bacterium]MYB38808.1 phosphodiesterase [Gammaproteobacteria bacterium]